MGLFLSKRGVESVVALFIAGASCAAGEAPSIRVGTYPQQIATAYTTQEGLPSNAVLAVAIGPDGLVYAGTSRGLARLAGGRWSALDGFSDRPVTALAVGGDSVYAAVAGRVRRVLPPEGEAPGLRIPVEGTAAAPTSLAVGTGGDAPLFVGTEQGLWVAEQGGLVPDGPLNDLLGSDKAIWHVAVSGKPPGAVAVAAGAGLFFCESCSSARVWKRLLPHQGKRSWAPVDVRGVAFDARGQLWFASPQGVGSYDLAESRWTLYDGSDGLPYDDVTSIAAGPNGEVWLGTRIGAIRFDGEAWEYRQGRRWLPNDAVRAVAVDEGGRAWIATAGGVVLIEERPMTLAEKARFFEEEIDRYHRRTPYGYVNSVRLREPGDKSAWRQMDSDNDGLWTSMYGAGECFAYAATGNELARKRAHQAFEALRFLGEVTQGGTHPAPAGFVARTILPTDGPDPNRGRIERDRKRKADEDKAWKILDPRWPVSEDGRWYWKTDASSDELDGHYFFYALYYDLVAKSAQERERVREVVVRLTDHLIAHDFSLVDHDGRHTRWAVFGPRQLNQEKIWWGERGLNSLSILSYLKVAEHVSGESKYGAIAQELIDEHAYATNVRVPKIHTGPGTGNQSDDEMAFMSFYNLVRYEKDPALKELWCHAFFRYWQMERWEMNPLFNFLFAASCHGEIYRGTFGDVKLDPYGGWLEDAVETLKRYPLDRVLWGFRNSHRTDIVFLSGSRTRGHRRSGKVLPIDERFVEHWNHDPWALDGPGDGTMLADGASFLLPYYLGLYHGFLED